MNAKTEKTAQTAPAADTASKPQVLPDVSEQNIRRLGKDEKPLASLTVKGDDWSTARVEANYEVGNTAAIKKSHQAHSVLDFSGCSMEEILRLASRPVVIGLQRRWNTIAGSDMSKATVPGLFATVDVKRDIVDASRQSAPPAAKASKLVDKLSPQEKAALIEKLQAELNGS